MEKYTQFSFRFWLFFLPAWGVSGCSFLIGPQKLLKYFYGLAVVPHCVSVESFTVEATEAKSLPFAEFVSLHISSVSCASGPNDVTDE